MERGLTAEILTVARASGASAVGVAGVEVFERERVAMNEAVRSGRSGPLHFTTDDPDTATDVTRSMPWAQTLVVMAAGYADSAPGPVSTGAVVGRFAGADHYQSLHRAGEAVSAALRERGYRAEALIDDNRLIDRGAATRAGIGWWGKSTMVLLPGHGPWALLGSVVTDAPLEPSPPMIRGCGTCTACIPACPTGALDEQGLDARRCLSTWLQSPGAIPHWIRPLLGRRIYGCDDCLTSCPPGFPASRRSPVGAESLPFAELLSLEDDDLTTRFRWWYVPKGDGRYLRRNVLIAAGNSREPAAWPAIVAHLDHRSSMIRGVAAWAMAKSGSPDAESMISEKIGIEPTAEARDELTLASMALRETHAYETVLQADEWAATAHGVQGLALIPSRHEPIGLLAMGSNLASDGVEVRDLGWWSRLGRDQLAGMTLIRDDTRALAELRIEARREQRAREHSMGSLSRRKL